MEMAGDAADYRRGTPALIGPALRPQRRGGGRNRRRGRTTVCPVRDTGLQEPLLSDI